MVVGSLTIETDVVVIGSGPGGYVAAIRAAQLGKDVMVVEESKKIGGICLHKGCIPTKALIHASYAFNTVNTLTEMGVTIKDYELDLGQMMKWKDGVVTQLEDGIKFLFKKYGIEVIEGRGVFENSNTLQIQGKSDVNTIKFKDAIVASGSSIIELPIFPLSNERILGSDELIKMDHVPKKLVVIGGGYIGTELSTVYAKLGSEVHIVEAQDRLLSVFEKDIDEVITKKLESLGVKIHTNTKALGFEEMENGIKAKLEENGKNVLLEADYICVVVGRKPNTTNMGFEKTKVNLDEKGFVHVDDQMRTADPHIYAIGDIVGQPMLAHKATKEGKVAAESICGLPASFDNQVIPAVVFNDPEIMTVGLTKPQAEAQGLEVIEGKFPYKALGRALTMNAPEGFIKIVAEKETERVVGVHAIGPHVSDITGEAVLAIEMGATLDDIALSIHAHPTVSESLGEAAEVAKGSAIHVYQAPKSEKKK